MDRIRTLGHGTLAADEFAGLAHGAGIATVVDIRRFPASRRHPHFASGAMASWLPAGGVQYRGIPGLGGRRTAEPGSPNVGLRNAAFRGYADHMATAEFAEGIVELLDLAATVPVAVLCAESVWWRCHRRLLADHLALVEQVAVEHLFHDGRVAPHLPTPEARRDGSRVVYDLTVQGDLFPPAAPAVSSGRRGRTSRTG